MICSEEEFQLSYLVPLIHKNHIEADTFKSKNILLKFWLRVVWQQETEHLNEQEILKLKQYISHHLT